MAAGVSLSVCLQDFATEWSCRALSSFRIQLRASLSFKVGLRASLFQNKAEGDSFLQDGIAGVSFKDKAKGVSFQDTTAGVSFLQNKTVGAYLLQGRNAGVSFFRD